MVIRYELTLDDLIAFNRYHVAHSRTIQTQKYFVIAVVGLVAIGAGVAIESEIPLFARVFSAIIFAALFRFAYHLFFGLALRRQTRQLLSEGSNDGILGPHELELNDKFLTERTDVNESRHAWSAINRIEETDEHAFLYISSLQAHVIPTREVISGDVDQFIQRSRQLLAAAQQLE
jgi:hypothetical protein